MNYEDGNKVVKHLESAKSSLGNALIAMQEAHCDDNLRYELVEIIMRVKKYQERIDKETAPF